MIRLHDVTTPAQYKFSQPSLKLRVSARRKPRGFVEQEYGSVCTRTSSYYEASVDYRLVKGWRPISMKGMSGPFCSSLEAAIEVIMTYQDFQEHYRNA